MFHVVEVDGIWRAVICKNNKADKYGEPKNFLTRKDAQNWIDKRSYAGMSWRYEVVEVKNDQTELWDLD